MKLYLLDSNDAANLPVHRAITSELYGGGPELRLKQELLLGIGGWRLLSALDVHFISSLPVKRQPVCTAWVDTKPAQIVEAEG